MYLWCAQLTSTGSHRFRLDELPPLPPLPPLRVLGPSAPLPRPPAAAAAAVLLAPPVPMGPAVAVPGDERPGTVHVTPGAGS